MAKPRFTTRKEAKAEGWFSRRHRTDAENRAAREQFKNERTPEARRQRAYARGAERPKERDD